MSVTGLLVHRPPTYPEFGLIPSEAMRVPYWGAVRRLRIYPSAGILGGLLLARRPCPSSPRSNDGPLHRAEGAFHVVGVVLGQCRRTESIDASAASAALMLYSSLSACLGFIILIDLFVRLRLLLLRHCLSGRLCLGLLLGCCRIELHIVVTSNNLCCTVLRRT